MLRGLYQPCGCSYSAVGFDNPVTINWTRCDEHRRPEDAALTQSANEAAIKFQEAADRRLRELLARNGNSA